MIKCTHISHCLIVIPGQCPGDTCKFYTAPLHVSEERIEELEAECVKGEIRPFYCGTQYLDWQNKNCCRCRKSAPVNDQGQSEVFTCELEYCLTSACFGKGTVSEGIAARLGFKPASEVYTFKCREFEK